MKRFIAILFVFYLSSLIYAQFGSAPSGQTWTPYVQNIDGGVRWTDWSNAGRQNGIPSNFAYYTDINDYSGSFTQKLKSAIESASTYSINHGNVIVAVNIPAGSFTVTEQINLKSNVVIKGAGSNSTTLDFQTGISGSHCFYVSNSGYTEVTTVISGHTMGSTSITVASASNLTSGDFIDIRDERIGKYENGSVISYMIGQVIQVNHKLGNTLYLKDKLSLNHTEYTTKVYKLSNPIVNVGFEDIKVTRNITDGASGGFNLYFLYAANCWVKGCEIAYASSRNINIDNSTHITIKGNYIHHARDYNGSNGNGYGIALYNRSTNCLIEDNVLYHLRHHLLTFSSVNRNVFAYNYTWDIEATSDPAGDIQLHGNYSHRNLFEANNCERFQADDWFGYTQGYSQYY